MTAPHPNNNSNTSSDVVCDNGPVYFGAGEVDCEKGTVRNGPAHIERMITPGGHPVDYSQPAIPVQHRKYGNPIPIGLIAFSYAFMFVGCINLGVRGIKIPSAALPTLMLFVGITQTLVGWFEMFIGNTFSATIFIAFGGFSFSYVGMFLPAFGIAEAMTDKVTGEMSPDMNQSVGLFLGIWSATTFLFVLAALRSSVAILCVLVATTIAFGLLSAHSFTGNPTIQKAAGAFCIIDACFGFWAAMAGYWTPDTTYRWIRVDPIDISPKDC